MNYKELAQEIIETVDPKMIHHRALSLVNKKHKEQRQLFCLETNDLRVIWAYEDMINPKKQ